MSGPIELRMVLTDKTLDFLDEASGQWDKLRQFLVLKPHFSDQNREIVVLSSQRQMTTAPYRHLYTFSIKW